MSDNELLLKSEPVRRVQVFTGTGRRRTLALARSISAKGFPPHCEGS
jgi:hypothetical protein